MYAFSRPSPLSAHFSDWVIFCSFVKNLNLKMKLGTELQFINTNCCSLATNNIDSLNIYSIYFFFLIFWIFNWKIWNQKAKILSVLFFSLGNINILTLWQQNELSSTFGVKRIWYIFTFHKFLNTNKAKKKKWKPILTLTLKCKLVESLFLCKKCLYFQNEK